MSQIIDIGEIIIPFLILAWLWSDETRREKVIDSWESAIKWLESR